VSSGGKASVLAVVILFAATAPGGARQEVVFTVTAATGSYTGSSAELAHWARAARRRAGGALTRHQARWQAFEQLVDFAWYDAEAADRGLEVSADDVDREFAVHKRELFPTPRDFRQYLRATGETVRDIKRRVRLDLITNLIREQIIAPVAATVTDSVVEDYIAQHGLERVPERRDIRAIITKRRRAAVQAKRDLIEGKSWKFVARRYSIDLDTRRHAGRLPGLTRGTLERRLERAIFGAPRRRIRGPVRTRSGFWVFRVSRIKPARFRSEAASRRIVRRHLTRQAEDAELDRFVEEFGPKWKSRTTCAAEFQASRKCADHPPADA
jgi:foldase protein PrsA